MFKKPLGNIKTSAPLRSSDRRKLKQTITERFSLSKEDGDELIPDGILSVKFSTHLNEPGIVYLSSSGDPLWFSMGKGQGSDDIIPTVYTLWKRPALLPFISTPAAVIPILVGGADLMAPGVVQHTPGLNEGQLVSISQYDRTPNVVGPPLAVGRMAVDVEAFRDEDRKGKAVIVLHTWKDHLWNMGAGGEVPEGRTVTVSNGTESEAPSTEEEVNGHTSTPPAPPETTEETPLPITEEAGSNVTSSPPPSVTLSPQDVSVQLKSALIQAISTTLHALPSSIYPISSSTFYTTYILPYRRFDPTPSTTSIDIKHSTFKSLTAFLKSADKDGLIKLKEMKGKGNAGGDVIVMAVHPTHKDVLAHVKYATVGEVEAKREKKEAKEKERQEEERKRGRELIIKELWKPHLQTMSFFEGAGKDTSALYTRSEISQLVNAYAIEKNLVNAHDAKYVNTDAVLSQALAKKGTEVPEFLKRDEIISGILDHMQPWHSIESDGNEVIKKGALKPISVIVKIRQGRRASTLITGFEPFDVASAEELAEELRKTCASATSISPTPGKSTALEVLVQGKQIKAVTDLLIGRGVPKKWIESVDLGDRKK